MPTNYDNYFTFQKGGTTLISNTYGMLVTGQINGIPEREIEKISIPGMNGDLVYDFGKYRNILISYDCDIPKNFQSKMVQFNHDFGRLMDGYGYLEDSYDTDYYRMARFAGTRYSMGYAADSGHVTVNFDCKPQKFKQRGTDISVSGTTTITNPTGYEAWPMLFFTHGGTVTFTNQDGTGHSLTLDQSAITTYSNVTIDCELKTATNNSQTVNLNSYVSGIFPSIKSGNTTITVSNGAVFTMWPRWWTL